MDAPSMVQRSGDTLIVRSVVSGDQLYRENGGGGGGGSDVDTEIDEVNAHQKLVQRFITEKNAASETVNDNIDEVADSLIINETAKGDEDSSLPQCKIKRNYSCNSCNFFTQNPRHFLAHLRDIHGEKIIINECKHCLYASRHYQKLVRHMKMVHGSTEGLEEQAQSRKRASQLAREQKKRKQMDDPSTVVPSMSSIILTKSSSNPSMAGLGLAEAVVSASPHSGAENGNGDSLSQKFLKCSLCEFTTLYQTQIMEHERDVHHKTKFFRCQKCSYVTHIKARFSKHVKYHSMPMIKCVMCDFRTPYKWNLDRHMKNHGGSGPFKCSACNFTADIKQSLTVHEMNHHVPPVGHASGMSMSRRRNKVGGTDIIDNFGMMGEGSGIADALENQNSDEGFEGNEMSIKRAKYDLSDSNFGSMPADLSQRSATQTPKRASRPLPNLIPIQPIAHGPSHNDAVNLSIRSKIRPVDEAQLKESPEMRTAKAQQNMLATLFNAVANAAADDGFDGSETSQLSPASSASGAKRKNTNFFNELKRNFATGNQEGNNLMCQCGHVSKCLSEVIIHKKSCRRGADKHSSLSPINLTINNCGGSTRCQYCRHRCKTSADLFVHLQSCAEARSSADSFDSGSDIESVHDKIDVSEDMTDEGGIDMTTEPHPMENKVFVWNKMPSAAGAQHKSSDLHADELGGQVSEDSELNDDEKADESTYFGVETAPGYGEVTKKMNPEEEAASSSLKKVFKCPHCSFWASTASRFHVHIVGHLNKKPFECSLCSYRSNWRWDITKHIRLKTIRDVSHKSAKVLMNDETGRRNYTKYNKYITLMKVTEEDGDPKLLKSGEMTPSQEASLSFPRGGLDHRGDCMQAIDDEKMNSLNPPTPFMFDISTMNTALNAMAESVANANAVNDLERPHDTDGTKKVSFKCKKCNYRHTSRDVVLAHVKTHYNHQKEDDGAVGSPPPMPSLTALPNEYNNNVYGIFSAANKLLLQSSLNQMQSHQSSSASSQSLSLTEPKVTIAPIPTPNASTTNSTNENGETEEASSGAVNGWRGPAPYRCGHCHQVSNWKHVIQRHCRLKHDGDIRIEMTEKGSSVYQPLVSSGGAPAATVASTAPAVVVGAASASKGDREVPAAQSSSVKAIRIQSPNELNKVPADPVSQQIPIAQCSDSEQRKLIINLLSNPANINQLSILNGSIAFAIGNGQAPLLTLRCKLCNFDASNALALSQHIQTHITASDTSSKPSGDKLEPNAVIDLDDTITDNQITNSTTPTTSTAIETDTETRSMNARQIQKIQELRGQPQRDPSHDSLAETSDAKSEKCPHCPFTTTDAGAMKEHLVCHICVSGKVNMANCEFCDFSTSDDTKLSQHTNIHFGLIKNKQKTVAFYTSYDNLEITMIDQQHNNNNNNDNQHPNQYTLRTLYPKINNYDFQYSSDKENKILVDVDSGKIMK